MKKKYTETEIRDLSVEQKVILKLLVESEVKVVKIAVDSSPIMAEQMKNYFDSLHQLLNILS